MKKFLLLFTMFCQACFPNIGSAALSPDTGGYNSRLIHGYVASAQAGDDVWIQDGAYPFQSAAAITYASSSSANDAAAGTGCRTILVEGLDSSYVYQSETVTLNGTSNVTLSNSYLRINRVTCKTVGTGTVNDGQINVGFYTTALSVMAASTGVAQQAIYTVPAGKQLPAILGWSYGIENSGTAHAQLALEYRPNGESWQRLMLSSGADPSGLQSIKFAAPLILKPKTDLRIRIVSATGNPKVNAEIELYEKP